MRAEILRKMMKKSRDPPTITGNGTLIFDRYAIPTKCYKIPEPIETFSSVNKKCLENESQESDLASILTSSESRVINQQKSYYFRMLNA